MPDLILRPSNNPEKPWALQLRWHESLGETEYYTIARVSEEVARDIIAAGAAFWLFGDPDDSKGPENKPMLTLQILRNDRWENHSVDYRSLQVALLHQQQSEYTEGSPARLVTLKPRSAQPWRRAERSKMSDNSNPSPGTSWRHRKRGTIYTVVAHAELQMASDLVDGSELVIYQGEDGRWWARQVDEFKDGRFEQVQP